MNTYTITLTLSLALNTYIWGSQRLRVKMILNILENSVTD